jgi:hypothetical protein
MNLTEEQIATVALALPTHARAVLADRLAASLDPADDSIFLAAWVDEAERRREEVRNGLVKTIPGEEALASVRKAVGR